MTDKPVKLVPIRLMDKNLPAKLAVQAMNQRQAITLLNGLKLNYDQKGSIEVDFKMACDFDNQWAAEHPEEAALYQAKIDSLHQYNNQLKRA